MSDFANGATFYMGGGEVRIAPLESVTTVLAETVNRVAPRA